MEYDIDKFSDINSKKILVDRVMAISKSDIERDILVKRLIIERFILFIVMSALSITVTMMISKSASLSILLICPFMFLFFSLIAFVSYKKNENSNPNFAHFNFSPDQLIKWSTKDLISWLEEKEFRYSEFISFTRDGERVFLPFQQDMCFIKYKRKSVSDVISILGMSSEAMKEEILGLWKREADEVIKLSRKYIIKILLVITLGLIFDITFSSTNSLAFISSFTIMLAVPFYIFDHSIPLELMLRSKKYNNSEYLDNKDDEYLCIMLIGMRFLREQKINSYTSFELIRKDPYQDSTEPDPIIFFN